MVPIRVNVSIASPNRNSCGCVIFVLSFVVVCILYRNYRGFSVQFVGLGTVGVI